MNSLTKIACTALALTSIAAPAVANSVDVNVTGRLVPVACTPSVVGGGIVNYGTIKAADLNSADGYTILSGHTLDFSIACDSPTRIALKAINGRTDTLVGENDGENGAPAPPEVQIFGLRGLTSVGLGLDGTRRIGGYALNMTSPMVDGVTATSIMQNGATWTVGLNALLYGGGASPRIWSWMDNGSPTVTPSALENFNASLHLVAFINKPSELDTTKPIVLNGLTTLEVIYL
ncbi:DUF1120 domain-containing protein [Pantoea sp. GM01]|uniref:DUF1120 domain-containing protein n=1 Tax=Pantoea sp. GM01 TaxID=1144320 RepID=UPI00027125C9|nr:DUF1120 domain-containing protein [Pantoea sp. GM01]EJL85158.1 Protein of unknown function (DUF1120) [Pantoea sp. GM01]